METRKLSNQDVRGLFDGSRLRAARELRAMTQKRLAELASEAGSESLTGAAVSQFEKTGANAVVPTTDRIAALASALDVPAAYFAKIENFDAEVPAYFRSLRSTSATQRKRARATAHLVWQFTSALERHVQLPACDIPPHPVSLEATQDEVEEIAGRVRREWGMAPGRVENVVHELERHGAVVVRLTTDEKKMDAFSVAFPRRPVVVLTDDKGDRSRSRFDAAHELGHLVMHDPDERAEKQAERQADWFAAAFLMPRDDIESKLPTSIQWPQFFDLKREWHVSVAALLRRAHTLGTIPSKQTYVNAVKAMSARGWRTNEPGDIGPPESPVLLSRSVQALPAEESLTGVALAAGLPADDLARIIGMSTDPRPQVTI